MFWRMTTMFSRFLVLYVINNDIVEVKERKLPVRLNDWDSISTPVTAMTMPLWLAAEDFLGREDFFPVVDDCSSGMRVCTAVAADGLADVREFGLERGCGGGWTTCGCWLWLWPWLWLCAVIDGTCDADEEGNIRPRTKIGMATGYAGVASRQHTSRSIANLPIHNWFSKENRKYSHRTAIDWLTWLFGCSSAE